jgi:hypothetical protein
LIGDRDKGLLATNVVMGNGVAGAFCCFHLKVNFRKRFTQGLESHFWQIAHAKTSDSCEAITLLRNLSTATADYLCNIDKALWVTAFFPGRCYGHKTSNIVESTNNGLKQESKLSILDLLNSVVHEPAQLVAPLDSRAQAQVNNLRLFRSATYPHTCAAQSYSFLT